MPEWPCPALDGYTATGDSEKETAEDLVDHLVKMHAKPPFLRIDPSLVDGVLGGADAEVRVKAGPAKGEVEAKRR